MARAPREAGFSRRHRFTARGAFGPVLRRPRSKGEWVTVQVLPGTPGASRLGVALTRRLARSAVARNRVKRIVREVFRHHAVKSAGLDCVVTLREPFDRSASEALRRDVERLFGAIPKGDR